MKLNFVSIFDQNYIVQGITTLESIIFSVPNSKIFVVAIDDRTNQILRDYFGNKVTIINLQERNELNYYFQKFRENRKYSESIFSLKAHALSYVMNMISQNDWAVYVDADVYFKSWPASIKVSDLHHFSYFISRHRFSKKNSGLRQYGDFNAGFVGFKKDNNGMSALKWWQECCDRKVDLKLTFENYADQGYLNLLPKRFGSALVLDSGQINQGMWNSPPCKLSDLVAVRNWEIFHFHGFRVTREYIFTDLNRYSYNIINLVYFAWIYVPYIAHTRKTIMELEKIGAVPDHGKLTRFSFYKILKFRLTFGLLKP